MGPLQAWFKEQDQLKLDRSDKQAQEQANNSAHHQATATVDDCGRMSNEDEETSLGSGQGFEDPGNSGSSQQAASIHDQASPQGFACTSSQGRAEPQYSDWTDGWQELFADRLQLRKRRRIVPPDPATFAPLSAPYTSWNDGWQKLFSQNTSPLQHGSVTC